MRLAATLIVNIESDQIATDDEILAMFSRWIKIQRELNHNINGFTIEIEDYFSLKLSKERERVADRKTASTGDLF